jgi:excisionase family DNA binding protein
VADQIQPIVFQSPPLSLAVADAAKALGCSRQTLEIIIKSGAVRCHALRPGGERRISYVELVRYVEARESVGFTERKG